MQMLGKYRPENSAKPQWYPRGIPLVRMGSVQPEVRRYPWFGTCGPLAGRPGNGNLVKSSEASHGCGMTATPAVECAQNLTRAAVGNSLRTFSFSRFGKMPRFA